MNQILFSVYSGNIQKCLLIQNDGQKFGLDPALP